jgi:hypothetical protein
MLKNYAFILPNLANSAYGWSPAQQHHKTWVIISQLNFII